MEVKNTSRKMQSAETKKKIYDTAVLLFNQYGYENVSVDSIVEKAGVSKGGFYVHFQSKDAILTEMINEYVGKLDFSYKSFLESYANSAKAADIILAFVDQIADAIEKVGYDLIKLAYRIHLDRNSKNDELLSYDRDIYRVFNALIEKGILQGEFAENFPVEMVSDQFVIVLRGYVYEWCVRYPEFDLKDRLQKHFFLLFAGIEKK